MRNKLIGLTIGVTLVLTIPGAAQAAQQRVFDYIPSPLPGNVASYSYESWGVAEAGDIISFEPDGPKTLLNAKVVLSVWACQVGTGWAQENTVPCVTTPGSTFEQEIVLSIYDPNDDMTMIDSRMQTFNIPFRPSSNPDCPDTVNGHGYGPDCFLGLAHTITFDLDGGLTPGGMEVPNEIVYGVAWNTSDYGYQPRGTGAACAAVQYAGCPYDLLNLGVEGTAPPAVGTDEAPEGIFQWSTFASAYCDGGEGGVWVFRLDDGCWGGFNPLVQFNVFVADTGGAGGVPPPGAPPSTTGPDVRLHKIRHMPRHPGANWNLNREFVVIKNVGVEPQPLAGWKLRDRQGNTFTFGAVTIQPGQRIRIHTGTGNDSQNHLFWDRNRSVWNPRRDKATLLNSAPARVDTCRYRGYQNPVLC
jgi:lamin tail-like protein